MPALRGEGGISEKMTIDDKGGGGSTKDAVLVIGCKRGVCQKAPKILRTNLKMK